MYTGISVVGERGQITIPKEIRDKEKLKKNVKVTVSLDNDLIVIKKMSSKAETEKLMAEYYRKYAKLDEEICKEWEHVSSEADELL